MVRSKIIKSALSLIAATSAHQVAGTATTNQAFLQREEDDNADNSSKCCNNPVILYSGAIAATAGGIVGGLFGAANCCPDTCSCLSCMRCGGNGGTDPQTGSVPVVDPTHGHGAAARPESFPEDQWPLPDGVTIVNESNGVPTIYELSDGSRIEGVNKPVGPTPTPKMCKKEGQWNNAADCVCPTTLKKCQVHVGTRSEGPGCCDKVSGKAWPTEHNPNPVAPVSYPYTYGSAQPDTKVRWLIADHFTNGKPGAKYLANFRNDPAKRGPRMMQLISNDWATQNKFTEADIATIAKTSEQNADKKYLQLMLKSKLPRVFAESEGHSRWNKDEFWVMGSVSVVIPVLIYDDGQWFTPKVHREPFPAYMIFMPGALMNQFSDLTNRQNPNGSINEKKFKQLYELRMLPPLIEANKIAGELGKKAVITLPGIGQGCFAQGQNVKEPFKKAIRGILSDNASKLKNIYLVQYNQHTPDGDENFNASIRQDYIPKDSAADLSNVLHFRRRNSDAGKPSTQQLNLPETYLNENVDKKVLSTHEGKFVLFNIVAWDHLSFPGNDIFPTHGSPGMRNTDDGVKASATNAIQVYQNLGDDYGFYNTQRSMFVPKGQSDWNSFPAVTDYQSLPAKVGGKTLQVEDLTFVDTGIQYNDGAPAS